MDEDRQKSTIIKISNLAKSVKLSIILSHLKKPLIDIWKFCNIDQKSAIQILRFENNSKFSDWGIENDVMNEYTRQYIRAVEYISKGGDENKLKVAQGLRPMLEMYCQVMFPKEYNDAKLLGKFCNYCKEVLGFDNELLTENQVKDLDELREALNPFHHSDFDSDLKEISDSYLKQLAERTLNFIQKKESDEYRTPF